METIIRTLICYEFIFFFTRKTNSFTCALSIHKGELRDEYLKGLEFGVYRPNSLGEGEGEKGHL